MKTRIFCAVLMLLFVLSSSIAYASVELTQSYKIDEGVTLHLPEDWTEIPKEMMYKTLEAMADSLGAAVPRYDFGFQLKKAKQIEYPYMFVLINNTGKIKESEFSNIKKISRELDKAADDMETKLGSILSNVDFGEQIYDEENKRLITKVKTDVAGVGPVYMLMTFQLTNRGFVQFMLYCEDADYDKYNETFNKIMDGVEVTGAASYTSTAAKSDQKPDIKSDTTAGSGSVSVTVPSGTQNTQSAAGTKSRSGGLKMPSIDTPVLILAGVLVVGTIIFLIRRAGSGRKKASNAVTGGYTDWFCPKCRHGNPASTSVCLSCNHSLV